MADEKVILEIEFDDGSVKQAFAKINKQAKSSQDDLNKGFEGSGKSAGSSFAGSFSSSISNVSVAALGQIGLIIFAVQKLADLTK